VVLYALLVVSRSSIAQALLLLSLMFLPCKCNRCKQNSTNTHIRPTTEAPVHVQIHIYDWKETVRERESERGERKWRRISRDSLIVLLIFVCFIVICAGDCCHHRCCSPCHYCGCFFHVPSPSPIPSATNSFDTLCGCLIAGVVQFPLWKLVSACFGCVSKLKPKPKPGWGLGIGEVESCRFLCLVSCLCLCYNEYIAVAVLLFKSKHIITAARI